jgi:acetoin:2,6-dichlorophenolindophenol oxidoreductase subunit alpha
MLRVRRFEEKIIELYPAQNMRTPVHLCIGQEAIAAGVCENLQREDYLFTTHRNHGHCLAKGINVASLMAEFYGNVTGCSKGKGGSMHPVAPECGILGTSAIVGGCIALATGTALASRLRQDGKISVAFFGDGATDEGIFHESLNFASLKKLPVLFICENNFYATNSPLAARQPHDNIAKRGASYHIPGVQVDGNDVLQIYQAAKRAAARARAGRGPSLIECRTYRWKGHVGPDCDYDKGCRPEKELQDWMQRCPIERFQAHVLAHKIMTAAAINAFIDIIDAELAAAVTFGQESPVPDQSDLLKHVYFERE